MAIPAKMEKHRVAGLNGTMPVFELDDASHIDSVAWCAFPCVDRRHAAEEPAHCHLFDRFSVRHEVQWSIEMRSRMLTEAERVIAGDIAALEALNHLLTKCRMGRPDRHSGFHRMRQIDESRQISIEQCCEIDSLHSIHPGSRCDGHNEDDERSGENEADACLHLERVEHRRHQVEE